MGIEGKSPNVDQAFAWEGWRNQNAALVIAHPGHELRVHHWLEQARPLVFTLTDGSGHTGSSRLASTEAVLERAGARPSTFFGRMSDGELYAAILGKKSVRFRELIQEIACALESAKIELVVGDAVEGFNPGHDICRLLINAALSEIRKSTGRVLHNFEFPLERLCLHNRPVGTADSIILNLDEDAFARKLQAAESYPELKHELSRIRAALGPSSFRVELLSRVHYELDISGCFEHPPEYELWGEKRVREGHYSQVLRYREHMAPLAEELLLGECAEASKSLERSKRVRFPSVGYRR